MNFEHACENKTAQLDIWNEKKKKIAIQEIAREQSDKEKLANNEAISFPIQKNIYWIDFGENIGYEISQKHPGLVISANRYNKTGTVIVAPISSGKIRRNLHILQCQYVLYQYKYPALEKDCLIKLDQMRTLSVSRVLNEMCTVSSEDWSRITSRLKTTFDIS